MFYSKFLWMSLSLYILCFNFTRSIDLRYFHKILESPPRSRICVDFVLKLMTRPHTPTPVSSVLLCYIIYKLTPGSGFERLPSVSFL